MPYVDPPRSVARSQALGLGAACKARQRPGRAGSAAAAGLAALLMSGCAGLPFFSTPAAESEAAMPAVADRQAEAAAGALAALAAPAPAPSAASTPASAPIAPVTTAAPVPVVSAPVEPPLPPIDAATRASFDEAVRMLRGGRLPEAERALKALAAAQPQLAGVHANLGLLHRKAGRLEESAAELQQAVSLSPKQAAYYNQLGITWRALGRFDHARKAYETAIELDPAHAGALINLAILNDLYLGEPARATELYTRGAALLPNEAATINKWLAELKNRKADPKLAASAAGAAPAPAPAPTGSTGAAAPPRKEKE